MIWLVNYLYILNIMTVLFSVNTYDSDGDICDKCVLLHLNDTTTIKFDSVDELENFANDILEMLPEIKENVDRTK